MVAKMAVRKLLLFGLIWALGSPVVTMAGNIDRTPPSSPEPEELPEPMPQKRACTEDSECQENEYCGGRGPERRCIECFDCSKVKRRPRKSYEGRSCATHQSNCGDCFDNYDVVGGACLPKSNVTNEVLIPHPTTRYIASDEAVVPVAPIRNENEGPVVSSTTWNYQTLIIVSILCIIILIGSGILWVVQKAIRLALNLKTRLRRDDEEDTLTSYNSGPSELPTAPPASHDDDEYGRPPPYTPLSDTIRTVPGNIGGGTNSPGCLKKGKQLLPKRVSWMKLQASPFDVGNGAGSWASESGEPSERPESEDQTDNDRPAFLDSADTPGFSEEQNFRVQPQGLLRDDVDTTMRNITGRRLRGSVLAEDSRRTANAPRNRMRRHSQPRSVIPTAMRSPGVPVLQAATSSTASTVQPQSVVPSQTATAGGMGHLDSSLMDPIQTATAGGMGHLEPSLMVPIQTAIAGGVSHSGSSSMNPPLADPVMFRFHMDAFFQLGHGMFGGETSTPAFNPTAFSTPQRLTTSAPPSPRQIDDTHAHQLDEVHGYFQTSNISIDSGTGTNDRSNPSQSRSTSGTDLRRDRDFSDLDELMFDDEVHSPETNFAMQQEDIEMDQDEAVVP